MAVHTMSVLFPTAVVGSMPRPAFVRNILSQQTSGDTRERARWMDDAIRYIVALQEEVGLDVISDGEWRRQSYLGVIAELAHGFHVEPHPLPGRPLVFTVRDTLSPKHTGFLAAEARFLRSITKKRIKVALPSPGLLAERMWREDVSAQAYPRKEDFATACIPILRKEIELLEKEGVNIIQIDDPHLCLFVDDAVRRQYNNPDAAADFDVDAVNALVHGVSVPTCVHLCRRAGARSRGDLHFSGSYERILPQLNKLRVRELSLEFTLEGSGEPHILQKLRGDFVLNLGCLSVHHGQIDTTETIVGRIDAALRYVDAERITMSPDCGFAPSSTAIVDLNEVYHKLQNLVRAAAVLRERYHI